jgi:adenine-specific DNA-methyltransferase
MLELPRPSGERALPKEQGNRESSRKEKSKMKKPEKLPMCTPNLADEKYAVLALLFPNAVTETIDENGSVVRAIDAEILSQEINTHVVSGREERYQFTWPDKRKSVLLANAPTAATLRPCRGESVDFDNTENLYIEGDNLEVLKLLRETYLNRVKMIYIDPPYNTGNDFVYEDKWVVGSEKWAEMSGNYDEKGKRLVKNLDSNGRFHTDWLNMIYPRLRIAKDILDNEGLIFISVDDNELENLKKICNEIFGESNFVADLIWANKEGGGSSDSKLFRIKHEHLICYSKNIESVEISGVPVGNKERYKSGDEFESTRGRYYLQKLGMGTIRYSGSLDYPIIAPDGSAIMPADNNGGRKACWRWSRQKYKWGLENSFIEIKKDSNGIWTVYSKQYLNCDNDGNIIKRTQRPMGVINEYSSTQAAKLLESMGLGSFFSYAKPVELIRYLCERMVSSDHIVLDFFSGSATTAHAVMQLNAEDGGKRKFIMVQIPEQTDEESEAYKAGYKNICEIGKERLRRAGRKIIGSHHGTENPPLKIDSYRPDIGFRVLKLDSSNMKDVYYTPEEYAQMGFNLEGFTDNIKPDRSEEDLLFQVLLDLGIPLSAKITEKGGAYHVNGNYLIAHFGRVDTGIITAIARLQPHYAVFRDRSFQSDSALVNFEQVFNTYSPHTIRKVL